MVDYNVDIVDKMEKLVRQWFASDALQRYALQFLEDKRQEKMMFGRLAVIHYHMFGGKHGDIYGAAAAVELFVLASDILDDMQDGDSPHKAWMQVPAPLALHTAASLISLSQQAMLDSAANPEQGEAMIRMMNRQLLLAANGQMSDLTNEAADEQSYLEMVRQKSGALLVLACMAGVMAAGCGWNEEVEAYALELGVAAQLRNDLRDLTRWDDKSDFLQRKPTLLMMYLLESLSEQDYWIADYFHGTQAPEEVRERAAAFEEVCQRTGAVLYGSVMSRMHYNRFEELLDVLHFDDNWKSMLKKSMGA